MCPGAWSTSSLQAGERQSGAVGDLDDVGRLGPRRRGAELLLEHGDQARVALSQQVVEPVAVVGMDVGGGVGPADGRHGVDVVDVPVREQHRGRPQPVLRQHLAQRLLDPDPRVDDDALLPAPGART